MATVKRTIYPLVFDLFWSMFFPHNEYFLRSFQLERYLLMMMNGRDPITIKKDAMKLRQRILKQQ